jgi:hypothetical protein
LICFCQSSPHGFKREDRQGSQGRQGRQEEKVKNDFLGALGVLGANQDSKSKLNSFPRIGPSLQQNRASVSPW